VIIKVKTKAEACNPEANVTTNGQLIQSRTKDFEAKDKHFNQDEGQGKHQKKTTK